MNPTPAPSQQPLIVTPIDEPVFTSDLERANFYSKIGAENHQKTLFSLEKESFYSKLVPELFNKPGFEKSSVEKLEKHTGPFAVVYFDAKKFKSINDKYGHANGDRVIKAIGKAIKSASRVSSFHINNEEKAVNNDVLSHQSGDEFSALIMPMNNGTFKNKESAEMSAEIYIKRINSFLQEGVEIILEDGTALIIYPELTSGVFVGDISEKSDEPIDIYFKSCVDKADKVMSKNKSPSDR
jgi:diguanylate cyclase (GGDEF)-like protein